MRKNELVFNKNINNNYIIELYATNNDGKSCWLFGSGIGKNKLCAFIDLCIDLYCFNHIKEILFVRKIRCEYGKN